MYKSIVFLGFAHNTIVKDKDTSIRRRELATREDLPPLPVPFRPSSSSPEPQITISSLKKPPFIIIVIAHIIIAKRGKFNRQFNYDKTKERILSKNDQKSVGKEHARYFVKVVFHCGEQMNLERHKPFYFTD